jgi:hypothetical protein
MSNWSCEQSKNITILSFPAVVQPGYFDQITHKFLVPLLPCDTDFGDTDSLKRRTVTVLCLKEWCKCTEKIRSKEPVKKMLAVDKPTETLMTNDSHSGDNINYRHITIISYLLRVLIPFSKR